MAWALALADAGVVIGYAVFLVLMTIYVCVFWEGDEK